ncbi:MAG: hypothetical protein ACK559_31110, partial [bacterium]
GMAHTLQGAPQQQSIDGDGTHATERRSRTCDPRGHAWPGGHVHSSTSHMLTAEEVTQSNTAPLLKYRTSIVSPPPLFLQLQV